MKRRRLLQLGLGAAVLVGVAGGGIALIKPGLDEGRLSPEARSLMRAVALAVLEGLWPSPGPEREAQLARHLSTLESSIAGFPRATQNELSQLLALLCSSAGRWSLLGLHSDWSEASTAEVQTALQGLRASRLALRQQVYGALRDLNSALFFAEPAHWALVGYPGPRAIP